MPLLGPLASNGGPTQTVALLAGSPAIGAGDSSVCNSKPPQGVGGKDQRGFPRPTTTCSIGAFEAIQTYTVGWNSDTGAAGTLTQCVDPTNTACRLRDAIGDATSGSDTIVFNNTGRGTITVGSTLTLASSVTITGPTSRANVTVEAAATPKTATYGVFRVNTGVTANMSALTIANGNSAGNGGGIFNVGTLTVTNSTLSGNNALEGGGIFNVGTVTVTNSTLSGNSASGGGGLFNDGGTLTVTNSTFSGNSASNGVGGIFNNAGTLNLTNTIVAGNSNGDLGGDSAATTSHTLIGGTPLLAPLGTYGGSIQTVALLPGSLAIDAGDDTVCASTGPAGVNNKDQRGNTRSGNGAHCDIGAFESHGFTLAKTSGDSQSAPINTAFTNPLVVTVTAHVVGEPVEGGIVTFTGPSAGAGIVTNPVVATITGGQARSTPTANGTPGGPYPVSAVVATGTTPPAVSFSLVNANVAFTGISPASGATAGGNLVTLSGQGFGTATNTVVFLDGVALPATAIRSVTATMIVYTAPAHGSGTVTVTVVIGGVTVSGSVTYTYGTVMPIPAPRSGGGTGGHPAALPGSRPGGVIGGTTPNPMPPPRP